jgi:hypothetical protein
MKKNEYELPENKKQALSFTFSQFEGACLYFRRSIINLPSSLHKEQLLFYLDKLIDGKPHESLNDIGPLMLTLEAIVKHAAITRDMREHFAYLKDMFDALMGKLAKTTGADEH